MAKEYVQTWILAGYALFAAEGPKGLKIEVMAKMVNKSKSSFYHYFGELELFKDELMAYHLERAYDFANQIKSCNNIHPGLIEVMMDYKIDIFFYKQFRKVK